jgi:hypothetical protein
MIYNESWIAKNWRPLAALTYLIICLFDFCIMPTMIYMQQTSIHPLLKDLSEFNNPDVQKLILTHIFSQWDPLTLKYAGLFHVSFGAILGVSAWKRGTEKVERMRQVTALAQINADITRSNPSTNISITPTTSSTNNSGV